MPNVLEILLQGCDRKKTQFSVTATAEDDVIENDLEDIYDYIINSDSEPDFFRFS